ncbi:MAG: hypothetical protein VX700_12830 [Pseudomonadota bacterium]|nr:hypothetical protein [Pseudomonadota bacterium]
MIVLMLAVVGVMVLAHGGKIPAFMILSVFIYYIAIKRLTFLRVARFAVLCSLLLFIIVQVAQIIRLPHASVLNSERNFIQNITVVLASKLAWRQLETGYCFDNVVRAHRNENFENSKQAFWLDILVPRVLWSDKPNFSLGSQYARDYCKLHDRHPHHSSSITLLGQPVINGGLLGLILHGTILAAALGALTAVSFVAPGLPRIVVFALLPWWIDFDQDFALYFGNIVKFGLFMAPFIIFTSQHIGRRLGKTFLWPG